jgi:hypothetical protein
MKPRMMSKQAMDLLFDHILDGFKSSHKGIVDLFDMGIISAHEKTDLLLKNSERLIQRIAEFKAMEKLLAIFFACLFGYMQITGEDLEMRRARRGSRSGRRKSNREWYIES